MVGEFPPEDYLNGGVLNQVSIQHYLGLKKRRISDLISSLGPPGVSNHDGLVSYIVDEVLGDQCF
jgi:hypothetical protein